MVQFRPWMNGSSRQLLRAGTLVLSLGLAVVSPVLSQGPTLQIAATQPAQERASLEQALRLENEGRLSESLIAYDAWLEIQPRDSTGLARRGGVNFKLGNNVSALEDFDLAIAIEPRLTPHLWQRGIALYYAQRWDDCLEQFEVHRTVNPNDVENAAWHFLCAARRDGIEAAQDSLLPVGPDQRVPMESVYELYGGRTPASAVLEAARTEKRGPLAHRLFYGHLYLALWHEVHGRIGAAIRELKYAVDQNFPHYMGDVARVHLDWLEQGSAAAEIER